MAQTALTIFASVFCLSVIISPSTSVDANNKRMVGAGQDEVSVAAKVDDFIESELLQSKTPLAPTTSDEDFLRRVSFDLAGVVPTPRQITLFGLDHDLKKRQKLIGRLLESEEFSENLAGYWRDVIFSRATEVRANLARGLFTKWLTNRFESGATWDEIATELLTATGNVREEGATALVFAHNGDAQELASETSRIFLGIQLQCANCHDHPTDQWQRNDFHTLAAYFPRVRVRRVQTDARRTFEVVSFDVPLARSNRRINRARLFARLDRNSDGKVTTREIENTSIAGFFTRALQVGDKNKDKALSLEELKALPEPNKGRNRSSEYFMPDLSNPASPGERIDPAFFVSKIESPVGMKDLERRGELAKVITSTDNPWFARAFVNRVWAEMLGEGFYMPIDDIGPTRSPVFEQALVVLSDEFTASGYDIRWLYRTIANTRAYQRQARAKDPGDVSPPFAAATPTRLRADQLFNTITSVMGVQENLGRRTLAGSGGNAMYGRGRSARAQFNTLFGFDPSTPQDELTGTIPQALFMMNSPTVNNLIRGMGDTRLSRILREFDDDRDAIAELYLLVLAREPSKNEVAICLKHVKSNDSRSDAFEDIMWSLLNSSEFLTKR